MSDGPAPHGGRIDRDAQAAVDFRGGAAIGRGWFGREQFAQEGCGAVGPVRSVVAAGGGGRPVVLVMPRDRAQIIGIELVEACATQAELVRGGAGGDVVAAEGRQDFADQRGTETMGKLAIMFFIAARMPRPAALDERGLPAPLGLPSACATLRPPPGPRGRKCSPLLARLSGFARTLFTFARTATASMSRLPKISARRLKSRPPTLPGSKILTPSE